MSAGSRSMASPGIDRGVAGDLGPRPVADTQIGRRGVGTHPASSNDNDVRAPRSDGALPGDAMAIIEPWPVSVSQGGRARAAQRLAAAVCAPRGAVRRSPDRMDRWLRPADAGRAALPQPRDRRGLLPATGHPISDHAGGIGAPVTRADAALSRCAADLLLADRSACPVLRQLSVRKTMYRWS